ncbi:HAMP domain-containing histidine kinase [Flavobacteriaceae bacterium]|nr:HAMP domain-containing histidine kinase [Flavobacteriaceae bacterium]
MKRTLRFRIYQIGLLLLFSFIGLIFWKLYTFIEQAKLDEQRKMELITQSQIRLASAEINENIDIPVEIITSNKDIPMILVNEQGIIISTQNLDSKQRKDSLYLYEQLGIMKQNLPPIPVPMMDGGVQHVYYNYSNRLKQLQYYSILLIICLILLIGLFTGSYINSKKAYENKLWSGLARETAHQLGTPISGLYGWLELLKMDKNYDYIIQGIEKELERLHFVSNRFSAIGKLDDFQLKDLNILVKNRLKSFENRYAPNIQFNSKFKSTDPRVKVEEELLSWVIDNIIVNAIDAMKGNGALEIIVEAKKRFVRIEFRDSGPGIDEKLGKKIFQPGISSKADGWGVGLSLAKRIVEDFHKGSLYFKNKKKGTSFFIEIPLT